MKQLQKTKTMAFGKSIYLLGEDANGVRYWLERAQFDCDWYWGIGYVETYTNNKAPHLARDIASHQHFNGLFLNGSKCCIDLFNDLLVNTPLNDSEKWQLLELMQSAYTMRKYSDMLYTHGAHITHNVCGDTIANDSEYERINKIALPAILEEIYKLLSE